MARRTATRALGPPPRTEDHFRPASWGRSYQRPVFKAMLIDGYKRAMLLWHRKAGKDLTSLQVAKVLLTQRPGLVAHVFPTLKVGGEIVSQGITTQGVRAGESYLDVFPAEMVLRHNRAEKLVEFRPLNGARAGSIYQVMGADNLQGRRGPNAVGVIISEYQDMDPAVWTSIFEPMILANRGWVIFCLTPSETGKPHAELLWRMAQSNAEWFTSFQTIDTTRMDAEGEDGSPVVRQEDIAASRAAGTPEESIQREYYCSFARRLVGSIYGACLEEAERSGRVTRVPWDPQHPVGICLDIGRTDACAIVFWQHIGRDLRIIDYHAKKGEGQEFFGHLLKERKPYLYGRVILPWDARSEGFTTIETVERYFQRVGFRGVTVAPKTLVEQGILAVKSKFHRMAFDAVHCGVPPEPGEPALLDCLRNHRFPWNADKMDYSGPPVHDQYSHGCDALRTGVVGDLDAPMVDDEPQDRPRYARTMTDAVEPLAGRRYARHDMGGWG